MAPVDTTMQLLRGTARVRATLMNAGEQPVVGRPAIDERGTVAAMISEVSIDWAGITNPLGPSIVADITVCKPGTVGYDSRRTPCGAWPSNSTWNNAEYWPTILVNGSTSLPNDGRGLLIVTGDLAFGGGDEWDGLVLVGGQITDNGTGGSLASGADSQQLGRQLDHVVKAAAAPLKPKLPGEIRSWSRKEDP